VTQLTPAKQTGHRYPQFLPDGRNFVFYAQGSGDASGIFLGSLDRAEPKLLTASETAGAYREPNWMIFVQQTALVARRLDLARRELTGDRIILTNAVAHDNALNLGAFSVTAGPIAYRGNNAGKRQLTWLDRMGKVLGVAGEPESNNVAFPELSLDGKRVAVSRMLQNNVDVWLMDLIRGGLTRFTFDNANDDYPRWSPDGQWIVFGSTRKGARDLYLKLSSGAGVEKLLLETSYNKVPQDWSRDGRFLLYHTVDPKTGLDLWAVDMKADAPKPQLIVHSSFDERFGQFSPDGRWVAYATNESGRFEIVVQPFPEPSGKWQVSTTGGVQPRWRNDGKELYFIAPDGKLMAVPITSGDMTIDAGAPAALFPSRVPGGGSPNFFKHQYAVSPDGRFLLNQLVEEPSSLPITVIVNWDHESRRVGILR
jgi:Tol biopolymer transport system component